MKNKAYSTPVRTPMMYGGETKPKRKKMAMAGEATNAPAASMKEKSDGLTDADRQKLMKRKAQLEAGIESGNFSEEILKEMRMTLMQVNSQLGLSATKGRAPVDAPSGMMYGGKAKKK